MFDYTILERRLAICPILQVFSLAFTESAFMKQATPDKFLPKAGSIVLRFFV